MANKIGVTVYEKDYCWKGYTVVQLDQGTCVIDMNGNIIKYWKGIFGFPPRLLPGGDLLGTTILEGRFGKVVLTPFQFTESQNLVQVDFDGREKWRYDLTSTDPNWLLHQHHDIQREGCPAGCYAPGCDPLTDNGNTIMINRVIHRVPEITDHLICDDKIVEINWAGEVVWEWLASDHFDEFGFNDAAKEDIKTNPAFIAIDELEEEFGEKIGAFLHINSVSWLGENKWYDAGDERFNPKNIIISSRHGNFICIIDYKTGNVVWRMGPDYRDDPDGHLELQTIGQHQPHMIQKGMPGEGNILIFDNGGEMGYGTKFSRAYSRLIEIDPTTKKIVWQYPTKTKWLYSPYTSSVQRLPNGNTLISEGITGRIVEITKTNKVVWVCTPPLSKVYRAYRYPYSYITQVPEPDDNFIDTKNNIGNINVSRNFVDTVCVEAGTT